MKDLLNDIRKIVKKAKEGTFEIVLKGLTGANRFTGVAKKLKISVLINNAVEKKDPNRAIALLATRTWGDLFAEKKRCQLNGPINTNDLVFTIAVVDGKVTVTVQSDYLLSEAEGPKSDIAIAFQEFIDNANAVIDDILTRDRSLTLDEAIASFTKTKQVNQLTDFFEQKLSKVFFAVLVRKFATEISK